MGHLNGISEKHKATIIYIHHANKSSEGPDINKLMGSSTIDASVRAVFFLDEDGDKKRVLKVHKWNQGSPRPEDLEFVEFDEWDYGFIKADATKQKQIEMMYTEYMKNKTEVRATEMYSLVEANIGKVDKKTCQNARNAIGLTYEKRQKENGKIDHWWVKKQ